MAKGIQRLTRISTIDNIPTNTIHDSSDSLWVTKGSSKDDGRCSIFVGGIDVDVRSRLAGMQQVGRADEGNR